MNPPETPVKVCAQCGVAFPEGANYCPHCMARAREQRKPPMSGCAVALIVGLTILMGTAASCAISVGSGELFGGLFWFIAGFSLLGILLVVTFTLTRRQ